MTGEKVVIPDGREEQERLEAFVASHPKKPVVVVQGLGFVGSVMAVVIANALHRDYAVIGIDLPSPASYWKIDAINQGQMPVSSDDPKIDHFFKQAKLKENFIATHDAHAYALADVVVVDINLDVQKDSDEQRNLRGYEVDLSGFKKAMRSIAAACKPSALVLVESTVPPGTCEKIIRPIFQDEFEKRGIAGSVKLGHSYERVMPGPGYIDSIQSFYRVYAGINEDSADAVEDFLKTIIRVDEYPLTRLQSTTATEMSKVLENSYRAMNIAFVQEWTEFAENAGVNLFEVVDAIRMRPTHKNLMRPGLGVGGYCLTKDPLLASWASRQLFDGDPLPQSEAAVKINDRMPLHTFRVIRQKIKSPLKGKRFLLLGVSYLNDVGDTRYTPVELLYDQLLAEGCEITLQDPYVAFWEEKQLQIETNLESVLTTNYEALVLTTAHREYRENPALREWLREFPGRLWVFDAVSGLTREIIHDIKTKHQMAVIGRGDF